jgi:hypothetical protein
MKSDSEESSNYLKKFYFMFVFFSLFFSLTSLASDNLEKRIKKLEIEIIEFEKKNFPQQKKAAPRKTTTSKPVSSNRRPKKAKEIDVNFPEYDPNTKNIAVKKDAPPESIKITVDVKELETTNPDKMLLSSENNPTQANTTTIGIIKVNEMGNVEMFVENQNNHNMENNLKDISVIGKNKLDNMEVYSNDGISSTIKERGTNSSKQIVLAEKNINIKIEVFDYVNKTGNIINNKITAP